MIPRYLIDFSTEQLPRYETDVIIIGAGIAGLFTAIKASEKHRVLLISKRSLTDSNTQYAQGGIAAVMAEDDSPAFHLEDTLMAGAGLCDKDAVHVLVHEGPAGVRDLICMGTHFDEENGVIALTREGAHSQRRILHANGDATGAEIVRALSKQVLEHPRITVWENHFAIDLLTSDGECRGSIVQKPDGTKVIVEGKTTVLCTGGAGQMYRYTTNPEVATGDGIAMALRAGAFIRDMEFVQFHPTSLCYPGAPRFLITEAMRGEGAVLRNVAGERFMSRYDSLLELAPRDVVARAIVDEMERTQSTFVYLDITHQSPQFVKHRFPTIYEYCLKYKLDLTSDWIPVAPAAHYLMGGIRTDLNGETSIQRLFACGEASSTGVHGANRLASNSLSEAIVFGRRIVERIEGLQGTAPLKDVQAKEAARKSEKFSVAELRLKLQKLMLRYVALKRSGESLQKANQKLMDHLPNLHTKLTTEEDYEYANLLTCAWMTVRSAMARTESRGGHYREDFPVRDDLSWRMHTLLKRISANVEESVEDVRD